MRRIVHSAVIILTLCGMLAATLLPAHVAAAGNAPTTLPAPLPATAPTATISVSPTSGAIGQAVTVSGQAGAGGSVRVVWIYGAGEQTVSATIAAVAGGSYTAPVNVPLDAPTGSAQVCATVTGTPNARFTCTAFTVVAPSAGSVAGQAPVGSAGAGATFHLLNRAGQVVASAPLASNGAFQLSNVTPGLYQGVVEGSFSQFVRVDDIVVYPGRQTEARFVNPTGEQNLDGTPCLLTTDAKVAQLAGSPSHLNSDGIVDLDTLSVIQKAMFVGAYKGPMPKPKPGATYDFGIYIAGVTLNVDFEAYVQRRNNATVERVEYYLQNDRAAPVLIGSATAKPWRLQYNVGQLTPGQTKLIAVPVVNGVQQCVTSRTIQVIADPMKSPKFQPGAVTVWDTTIKAYHFMGWIPNAGGLLPAKLDTPSLPLIGVLENRLGAGVYVDGWLYLDGGLWFGALDAQAYARLMSIDVFNKRVELDPGGKLLAQWIKPQDLAAVTHQTPSFSLATFRQELTIFGGPLVAVPPWVLVRASISIGVGGDVSFSAVIQPLKPGVEAEVRPSVTAWLGLSIAVDILFGIAGAEGTVQPGLSLALPLKLNLDADPPVWFDDPCLSIFVRLILKGRFLFWSWTMLDEAIINEHVPGGCNAQAMLAAVEEARAAQTTATATLEAPAVASDPTGRMLMVYVEDAGGATPAPRIMARFKPAGSDAWSAPVAITDGTRSVSDPVAAFAGSMHTPMVAWVQNKLPRSAGTPTVGDVGAVLQQQEIMVATWDGSAWGAPAALTDDAVGDGRPALAGDVLGATLAWTRDTDGDLATRTDQRIAVREWTPIAGSSAGGWSAMLLLGAATSGMNAQVSAARIAIVDPAGGQIARRALVWSYDGDGDPNTNDDRRLAFATYNAGAWGATLLGEQTRRADSPTVALSVSDPEHAALAFLVRGKDGDGQTDIGPLSNRARLWVAVVTMSDGSVRSAQPAPGERGAPVYAERPRLVSAADGETLLTFRRFGNPGEHLWLGQVALARQASIGAAFSTPLLLTNEPRQNWQAALALNPSSGQATIAKIGSPPLLPLGAAAADVAAQLAAPASGDFAWNVMAAQDGATTLDLIALEPTADPALEPTLALAQAHPIPGSTVTVTATVRNLGRNTATEMSVCFYRGAPGSGSLIECRSTAPLTFNEQREIAVTMTAGSGAQPIYAEVTPSGEDANAQNNRAVADLGALPAPAIFGVQESTLYESALAIKWAAVDTPGVGGYRILRSTQPGGPYEVVGESTAPIFNDLPVARGQTYYYVVQAFDEAGVVSAYSQEMSGMLPQLTVFLPMLRR